MERDTAYKIIESNAIDLAISNGLFNSRKNVEEITNIFDALFSEDINDSKRNEYLGRIQLIINSNLSNGLYKTMAEITIVINAFNTISQPVKVKSPQKLETSDDSNNAETT